MKPEDLDKEDPDIVHVVLQHVMQVVPGFDAAMAAQIHQEVRERYGGMRVRIPKRWRWMPPEQRQQAYQDALANMPTNELLAKHKISLRTLYRLVKKGPGPSD